MGATPPLGLAERLSGVARVQTEWTPDAKLIALWAPSGLDQLRRLPARTLRPPVVVASDREPTEAERVKWIREGAEDVVSLNALPVALARRLQAEPTGRPAPSPTPARRDLVAPAVPNERTSTGAGGGMADGSLNSIQPARPRGRPDDAFPPMRVPQPNDRVPATVGPWVQALRRYLASRDQWIGRWGRDGLDRLLELAHLRAQVPSAAAPELALNTFGQAHGTGVEPLGWPMLVRRGPSRSRRIEVVEALVRHAGTDGMVVEVPFEATERQKIVADLTIDDGRNAQFLLEARWQRRIAAQRWSLGLLIIEMRIRALKD